MWENPNSEVILRKHLVYCREGNCPADFSNKLNETHLNQLIRVFRLNRNVQESVLELNSKRRPSKRRTVHPWFSAIKLEAVTVIITRWQCSFSMLRWNLIIPGKVRWSASGSQRVWLYLKSPPIPSNSALFEGTAILSGVRNHSGCSRVHSFNPTMHRKNECTTDEHSKARESP